MNSPDELNKYVEAFVRDHSKAVQGFLHARLGLPDDLIGEVMNDALLVIARKWREGNVPAEPRAYVLAVAKNAAIRRLKEKHRFVETPDLEAVEDSAGSIDPVIALTRSEDLRRVVQRLPRRQRQVIELRYLQDRSIAEAAAVLGITQGSVCTNASAALKRLRQIIEEEGGVEDWDRG